MEMIFIETLMYLIFACIIIFVSFLIKNYLISKYGLQYISENGNNIATMLGLILLSVIIFSLWMFTK